MADIGTFTEPKNKMVPLLPWEPWPPEFEVQKNDSLALIIEILYLRQYFFETDSCLLALTTSTSHMQSCPEIDRGLIKLFNVEFLCLKVRVSLMTIMKWRISRQGYKHLSRFSRFALSKPAASTMQKINPVCCFSLCH